MRPEQHQAEGNGSVQTEPLQKVKGYIQFTLGEHRRRRCCSQTEPAPSRCDLLRSTHHSTEVLVQNLHKVVNQFVHQQLVLWRQSPEFLCYNFGSHFTLKLIFFFFVFKLSFNVSHRSQICVSKAFKILCFMSTHLHLLEGCLHCARYNSHFPPGRRTFHPSDTYTLLPSPSKRLANSTYRILNMDFFYGISFNRVKLSAKL